MTETKWHKHYSAIDKSILRNIPRPNRVMAPFMWYGGKGNLAHKILKLLPEQSTYKVYVEPYCGAASIFFHKTPSPVEVLNDLNEEIINTFRVLQDHDGFEKLLHKLVWTPYSRAEFERALGMRNQKDINNVDRAWAFMVQQNQGFAGKGFTVGNWGRAFVSDRGMAGNVNRWRGRIKLLTWWHDRLSRVQLDNRDALEVIRYWDSPQTLFYIDPPYASSSRVKGSRNVYKHEASNEHYIQFINLLLDVKGQVVLSGYSNEIYKPLDDDPAWQRHEIITSCHAAGRVRGSKLRGKGSATKHTQRVEVVWRKVKIREGNRGLFDFG